MQDTERAQLEAVLEIVSEAVERIENEVRPVGIGAEECLLASVLNMMSLCCEQHRQQVISRVRDWIASVEDSEPELH